MTCDPYAFTRPGFVIAPWCGSADCEAQIKTETQATIQRILLVARIDVTVLLLVVADMVTKPFS